ncbi:MAG: PadR family transcriptional regulator [Bryobacteraceae bacterium]
MDKSDDVRVELLQGTLDMLVLQTLLFGPCHGHAITKHIQRTSDEALLVEHGSLYPALHRLERQGWVTTKWDKAPGKNREVKYYLLTPGGKKQLVAQQNKWALLVAAIGKVMRPV